MKPDNGKEKAIPRFFRLVLRPEMTMAVLLGGALVYKIKIMQPRATDSIHFAVVQHDFGILALVLFLYAVARAIAQHVKVATLPLVGSVGALLNRMFLGSLLLVILLYLVDIFVFFFFGTRLYASDVVTFSSELGSAFSLLRTGARVIADLPAWKLAAIAAIAFLFLRTSYVLIVKSPQSIISILAVLSVAVVSTVIYLAPVPNYVYSFGDKPLFENFIERNRGFFLDGNFSDGFRKQLITVPALPETCNSGKHLRLNVVLVIVESLSAYHSKFFSGIEDWTPELDGIAMRETALTNFHANGWTTIGGLISLVGRTFPFVPEKTKFNEWGSARLTDFMGLLNPLPRMLANQGYATIFLSAGDLGFLSQGDWLGAIGFQKLIGHDDPRFANQKVRGPFESVPDRLLFDEAVKEIGLLNVDRPYFMVVQTFWSHRPFMAPDGSKLHGEEPVIREADRQLGALYEKLESKGFFDNGLLIITGDHRAMEPFRKVEFERFGRSAVTRIPAVVATRAVALPSVIGEDFQQRDLGASIQALVGETYCLMPYEGAFLAEPPKPSRCVMHTSGDDRNRILVKCGSQEGTVQVAGDATRLASGEVDDHVSIIQTINVTRMRGQ